MITGTLHNWSQHLAGPVWEKAFAFIQSLTPESPDEKTLLQGEDLFASVATYPTIMPAETDVESHRKYVDIQAMIKGTEILDWYPIGGWN